MQHHYGIQIPEVCCIHELQPEVMAFLHVGDPELLPRCHAASGVWPPRGPCMTNMFTHFGTARNYIGHLKNGCIIKRYTNMSWYDAEVLLAIKSVSSVALATWGESSQVEWWMPLVAQQALATYFDAMSEVNFSAMISTSFEFLLRTKSEGLKVWKGSASDINVLGEQCLPDNRPNGFHFNKKDELVFVLKQESTATKVLPYTANVFAGQERFVQIAR